MISIWARVISISIRLRPRSTPKVSVVPAGPLILEMTSSILKSVMSTSSTVWSRSFFLSPASAAGPPSIKPETRIPSSFWSKMAPIPSNSPEML